jgi:hypothetical protein
MTFFAQVVVVRADSLEHADMLLWRKLHSDDDVPFVGDPWEVTPTNPPDEPDPEFDSLASIAQVPTEGFPLS